MKVFCYGLAVVGLCLVIGFNLAIGASFNQVQNLIVTSTGITGLTFSKVTQEVYIVNNTTTPCYINFKSSTTVPVTGLALGRIGSTDILWVAPEVRSSYMAVRQDTGPVNIRIQGRWTE